MEKRRLGQSDIFISPIGLGCWQFSEGNSITGTYWPALSAEITKDIVATMFNGGVNWFDTAEAYGWGRSEAGLANSLKQLNVKDKDVVIATKWFPIFRTARSITSTIEKRLSFLDGYSIDLHQIHSPFGSFSSHKSQLSALADLVKDGKIKSIGVSNFNAKQMCAAYDYLESKGIPLVSNQMHYNLLHRNIEKNEVLKTAKERKISIIAYSPLAQGLLSGKFHEDPELIKNRVGPRKRLSKFSKKGLAKSAPLINVLKEIASKYELSPAQVALLWLIQVHGDTVVAIPGATKISHATQNVGAMDVILSEGELDLLDKTSSSIQ